MKKDLISIGCLLAAVVLASCAAVPPDRYNTQRGAAIGAGAGALLGQAIGRSTEGTLIGLAAGSVLGALVGNARDQDYQAVRDAAHVGKPIVYYDRNGEAVEAVPQPPNPNERCRRVTKRVWKDGELKSETIEEVCEDPPSNPPRRISVYPYYSPYFSFSYHDYPWSVHSAPSGWCRRYPYRRW